MKVLFTVVQFTLDTFIYLRRELYKYDITDHDVINSNCPDNILVRGTDDKYNYLTASHIKKKYQLYKVILDNGMQITCADEHLFASVHGYCVFAKNLKIGELLITTKGPARVKKKINLKNNSFTFDLTVAVQDKLYYTNDILSHNSVTSAIFLVWYLLNHSDRNVMCVSENGDKVEELMDKIDVVMKNLPFFMKLGMIKNDIYTKIFDNNCKLKGQKTTENTGASFTIHVLYADEFALVNKRFLNKFYATIYPTLSSSDVARMIITSTPRGLNKFYDIYNDALESKNRFNPIRTDWYEVPLTNKTTGDPLTDDNGNIVYRGEEWKQEQIADLGSIEDFNQEFGNQFLAGNQLLLGSSSARKLKAYKVEYVHRDIPALDDRDIEYEGILTWHPKFDIENLYNETCRFAISIDLADGGGGDYSVANIFQLLPMSKKEIQALKIFSDEKDFFKLVQVGLLNSNTLALPEFAQVVYNLVVYVINHENVKATLEMNHEGNYFKELVLSIDGEDNEIEEDHFFVKYKYNMADDRSDVYRVGLMQSPATRDLGCKMIKSKVKYNHLVITEKMTVEESISFSKNDSGKYEGQTRNDDKVLTCINICHYYKTTDFIEQVEEVMMYCPREFGELINKKLGRTNTKQDGDGLADILL